MLSHVAICGGSVLVHYPTVGAEGELLPLVVPIVDGYPRQAISLVELADHIFLF